MAVEENFLIDYTKNLIIRYVERGIFVMIMQRVCIIQEDILMEKVLMVNSPIMRTVLI